VTLLYKRNKGRFLVVDKSINKAKYKVIATS